MVPTINIAVAVDVVAALSGSAPEDIVFLVDDSPGPSVGKGTSGLVTACVPGQLILWRGYAIDLQTPLSIRSIRFAGCPQWSVDAATDSDDSSGQDWRNDSHQWSGYVPWNLVPGEEYRYTLKLQMGTGPNCFISVDTPALRRVGA